MTSPARVICPWVLLASILTLASCGESADQEPTIEPQRGSFSKAEPATSRLPARDLDPASLRNMSRLIAGELPDSSLAGGEDPADEPSPAWRDHARQMDEIWRSLEERLAGMRDWAERELADVPDPSALLFYPFGGPDLVTALQFFPNASSYFLVGLEAPGSLPMPENFDVSTLASDLERLRVPFSAFVESGYFVRTEIDRELDGGHFDGILPVLLACLVRAGQTPIDLSYVEIDGDTLEIRPVSQDAFEARAVRVQFVTREEADQILEAEAEGAPPPASIAPRSVYYFSQDLSNSAILLDEPFSRLIAQQRAINTYIKSGEYLAHTDDFSNFRKLVLDHSLTLLQDDSGLPIRFLRSDHWDVRLFGVYTGVLAAYSQWFQEDLAAAFRKPGAAEPLDFAAGYNTTTDGGGLILANRRPPESGDDGGG